MTMGVFEVFSALSRRATESATNQLLRPTVKIIYYLLLNLRMWRPELLLAGRGHFNHMLLPLPVVLQSHQSLTVVLLPLTQIL
jgi:hypothetical protein